MSDRPAEVAITGVRKSFGPRVVLDGLDLTVPAGTMTAVLGPSGCGKTTLLRILAGFEQPDTGAVEIGGRAVVGSGRDTVPAHRRRVGLMPQEGALFPHLDVAGNVAFGLTRGRRSRTAAVAEHWLQIVGLDGLAAARPHQLSGGQQQRVALARALAAEPRVVLLDEPFAALDAALRIRVREDIATILRTAGTTSVLVTHDQAEALSLADSVALLMDGAIAQHGTPAELYSRPATLAAARFVGATVELTGDARDGVVHTVLGGHPARLPVLDGPVTVVLRPEQLQVLPAESGPPAEVTACRFYGAETAVHVVVGDNSPIVVRVPGEIELEPGKPVSVGVDGSVLAYRSPPGG